MRTRQLFFWLLFCVQISVISGQDSLTLTRPKIIIGTKAIWEISGDWYREAQSQSVYSFGLQIFKPSKNKFVQLETGLYLYSKAFAYDFPGNPDRKYVIFKYISIPANFRIDTKYFYISAGPNLDYLIALNRDNWPYYYSKADMNNIAIGFNANSGFQMAFHKTTIFIEARYSTNLTSYEKRNGFIYEQNFRNIGVGLGLRYSVRQRTKK